MTNPIDQLVDQLAARPLGVVRVEPGDTLLLLVPDLDEHVDASLAQLAADLKTHGIAVGVVGGVAGAAVVPAPPAPHVCPRCRVERADYEGPDAHLHACPMCGSTDAPVPIAVDPGITLPPAALDDDAPPPAPAYVHALLDAFLTGEPLNFRDELPPPDVRQRLDAAVADGTLGLAAGDVPADPSRPRPLERFDGQ